MASPSPFPPTARADDPIWKGRLEISGTSHIPGICDTTNGGECIFPVRHGKHRGQIFDSGTTVAGRYHHTYTGEKEHAMFVVKKEPCSHGCPKKGNICYRGQCYDYAPKDVKYGGGVLEEFHLDEIIDKGLDECVAYPFPETHLIPQAQSLRLHPHYDEAWSGSPLDEELAKFGFS
ncbi:hypothetical protein JDV02_002959 [Purpureocillium takamizusanense]|uniref:Uncharacterized protein n=1 Tax=Purpureocillium takamizusanense TaxID=2060973 RepID=A0A9Q8QCQ6_9HYPO|nr:uncharacterized protein JDV02_002959 [Purpureocillium takamizusanense]UNI16531.1 hypothetical protein JDV02_002959 [Purpureocillium takamizusanense]